MLRFLLLLAAITALVWRFAPRMRVTWFAVVVVFLAVVGVRAALQQWGGTAA